MSWRHVSLELSEKRSVAVTKPSPLWEGMPDYSSRATFSCERQILPSPSLPGQQSHEGPSPLLASLVATVSVVYLHSWQCCAMVRASCMLGKNFTLG